MSVTDHSGATADRSSAGSNSWGRASWWRFSARTGTPGGSGDLLATAAMGDWTEADSAHVAYGLSHWHPTAGTRLSGAVSRERRGDYRLRYSGGRWEHRTDAPPTLDWSFPEPLGTRRVI